MSLQDSGQYYHEVLKRIPPRDLPAFEDGAMQERVWGRRWGVYNDVGPLRTVLVHRPGDEIRIMTADRYDPSIEALIDDEAQWYWRGDRAPDLMVMQKEHDALVAALSREGAEVVQVGGSATDPKAMFTRDNGVIVPGGAIICRMGPVGSRPGMGRRVEEAHVQPRDRRLGMPTLRTIPARALRGWELRASERHDAVAGCLPPERGGGAPDRGGAVRSRIRLLRVPLDTRCTSTASSSWGQDLALINIERTPVLVPRHASRPQDPLGRGAPRRQPARPYCLPCGRQGPSPSTTADGTAERLVDHGVEVVPLQYAECQRNGGGIHCSTLPLCGIAPERGPVAGGHGADRPAISPSPYMPPAHGTQIAISSRRGARAVEAGGGGRLRVTVHDATPRWATRACSTSRSSRRRRRRPLGGEPAAG